MSCIKKDLLGIEQIADHINVLTGRNQYSREKIEVMKEAVKRNKVDIMTIEDSNTIGLSGADDTDQSSNSPFSAYAYTKGFHAELEDEDLESQRGGSHGVGKIATNAASLINLMYFLNCDEKGNQHIGGNIQLIEHEIDEQAYRSTGYFTNEKSPGEFTPYKNRGFHKVFNKNTRGLKVIIPYVSKDFIDQKEITNAIYDNYFMAIIECRLKVNINNKGELLTIDDSLF